MYFLFLLFSFLFQMTTAGTVAPSLGATHNVFATDLFRVITAKDQISHNIIYSPVSIHSCLTFVFMGTEGETADELRSSLRLGIVDKSEIAKNYGEFLKTEFNHNDKNSPILKMANRIYVNNNFQILQKFNEIAKNDFDSKAEYVNFADSSSAINQINTWVEQQTDNKIQNLLQDGSINGATSSILVNAIYFKAKWTKPFTVELTNKADFYVSSNQIVQVDTMYQDDKFKYADLSDLDAKAIELPYEGSNLSMLIILPNQKDGLKNLEKKLTTKDLNSISSKMVVEDVDVFLPKFKIEFGIDLKNHLEELGINQLFNDNANLSGLFSNAHNQKVLDVKHKAYLDVNEAGSEAAAATFLKVVPMSLNMNQKTFRADHPFVFAIRNNKAVFFAGHVVKF